MMLETETLSGKVALTAWGWRGVRCALEYTALASSAQHRRGERADLITWTCEDGPVSSVEWLVSTLKVEAGSLGRSRV